MDHVSVQTPWAGRFLENPDKAVQSYTRSLHLDRRLAPYDIQGSRAHVRMLAQQGIITHKDRDLILQGLNQIMDEIKADCFPYRDELEDIHMNIEVRLCELVGEEGRRLHTGRSRNDQVVLDLKLFCLDTVLAWQNMVRQMQQILLTRARGLERDLFPGWTHLQAAQPLSWGQYLLAFCEMLGRDHGRLTAYHNLHNVSPLGAGALAGSTLPLDPAQTAQELGFFSSFGNSYDVVGDRDFILELLQIATQIMLHTSRMAEDMIYFSSTPVRWVELPDSLCTGSSMMPQKKNPDVLELCRGKTASVLGHNTALSVLLKGLPSSYHRDLQQDKEHLFPVVEIVSETLEILSLVINRFRIVSEQTSSALKSGFLTATDLAEYLVSRGVPFRTAHEQVGRVVALCVERDITLQELPLEEIQKLAPECGKDVQDVLKLEGALEKKVHKGSTGLHSIREQIRHWEDWLDFQVKGNRQEKEQT